MWYFQLSQLDAFYLHLANWFYISSCKSYFILLAIAYIENYIRLFIQILNFFIWFEIDISAVGMYVCVFQQTKIFFKLKNHSLQYSARDKKCQNWLLCWTGRRDFFWPSNKVLMPMHSVKRSSLNAALNSKPFEQKFISILLGKSQSKNLNWFFNQQSAQVIWNHSRSSRIIN